jgi:hypothetical protein
MAFATHDIARIEVIDIRPDLDDLSDKLMSDRHGHGDCLLRPLVPVVDVNVCAADAGVAHTNQHVVDADHRLRYIFQPKAALGLALD